MTSFSRIVSQTNPVQVRNREIEKIVFIFCLSKSGVFSNRTSTVTGEDVHTTHAGRFDRAVSYSIPICKRDVIVDVGPSAGSRVRRPARRPPISDGPQWPWPRPTAGAARPRVHRSGGPCPRIPRRRCAHPSRRPTGRSRRPGRPAAVARASAAASWPAPCVSIPVRPVMKDKPRTTRVFEVAEISRK